MMARHALVNIRSNGPLRTIPPGLLLPLQHLTKVPPVTVPPVTEDVYTSLQPFLCLFLSGNCLSTLPGELFELGTLRVLSLRNNKLDQIPPAIRRLTLLQELNLSVNRLQYLPWELLWLIRKGDLKHLTVRPNPLAQMEEADIATWHYPNHNITSGCTSPNENGTETEPENEAEANKEPEPPRLCTYEGPAPEEAWAPIHIATSPVQLFNMEGLPVRTAAKTKEEIGSRVPSLREVALLTLSKSSHFDFITDSDIAMFPGLMTRLLWQAREARNTGGRCCSVCHRNFVIPRAEWIEWWDCSTYENGLKGPRISGARLRSLPFKRLGCSWACAPGLGEACSERLHSPMSVD